MKVEVRLPDMSNVYGHDRTYGFNEEIERQSDPIEEGEDPDWVYGMYMSSAFSKQGYVWGGPSSFPKDRTYKVFVRLIDLQHRPRKCVKALNSYDLDFLFMCYHRLPPRSMYHHGTIEPDYYWKYFERGKAWLPWSYNPKIFYPVDDEPKYDVTFLSIVSGSYPLRIRISKRLRSLCEEKGWRLFAPDMPPNKYTRNITGRSYEEALRSTKVFITGTSMFRYALRKWFEVMGSGTCMLSDPPKSAELLGLEAGKNFLGINKKNWEDRVEWILENDGERKKIAKAGHNLMLKRHTHEVRVKEMFEALRSYG